MNRKHILKPVKMNEWFKVTNTHPFGSYGTWKITEELDLFGTTYLTLKSKNGSTIQAELQWLKERGFNYEL